MSRNIMPRENLAQVVVGSKAQFSVELVDEHGKCFDISEFVSGTAVFCNCDGERIEIILAVPGLTPTKGILNVTIPAIETAKFDDKSKDFDIELIDAFGDTTIVVINDKIELIDRNCP